VFLFFLISCSKDKLIDEAPSLVGTWKHFYSEEAWDIITISSDGTGKVDYFTNSKLKEETKVKDWYIKDDRLYLGKVTFSLQPYTVSEYPTTASINFIEASDTVFIGERYLEFNQLIFVEKN
jgi:hypothetical protein